MAFRNELATAFRRTIPGLTNGDHVEKAIPSLPGVFWSGGVPGELAVSLGLVSPDSEATQGMAAYRAAALAYVCINFRVQKLKEAPLCVKEITDDGEELLQQHPLQEQLRKPNPDYTMRRMYETSNLYRDLTGACLWVKIRDRGQRMAALYPFSGDDFEVRSSGDRLYGEFLVRTSRGHIKLGPEDVILFMNVDPQDPHDFVAPLDVALSTLNIGQQLRVQARNLLKNSLMPSGIVTFPDPMAPSQRTEIQNHVEATHAGAKNQGKLMMIDSGAKYQQTQAAITDALPKDMWDRVEAVTCAVFGVHPVLVGLQVGLENSPWSHFPTAKANFYDETILPRWEDDAEVLTEWLLRDTDTDPSHVIRFDTSRIRALREDNGPKAEIIQKVAPYLKTDEARQMLDLKPLEGDEGEQRYVPATWVPADMLAEMPEPVDVDGDVL